MSVPYERRFRMKVIEAVERGLSARAAGERFGIGVATSIRWVRRWRESGTLDDPPPRKRATVLDPHADWLIALREAERDLRLVDIAERLEAEHGVRTEKGALSRFYKQAGITFKKKPVRD
jgi:transposase